MKTKKLIVFGLVACVAFAAGCKKNAVDKGAFKTAIDHYLASQQQCLWSTPIKLPAQADTSDDEETKGFDALTDAGLLTRKAAEKKRFLIGSKQVNDYDLSTQGRSAWTADASQPGYGNFCYGRPQVTSIEGYTPAADNATNYQVTYHYAVQNLPSWANSAEMKTAFPRLATAASGAETGTANLVKSNDGWLVENTRSTAPASSTTPATQP